MKTGQFSRGRALWLSHTTGKPFLPVWAGQTQFCPVFDYALIFVVPNILQYFLDARNLLVKPNLYVGTFLFVNICPSVIRWILHEPEDIKALNSDDVQFIGYLASKGDVYIGYICSKGNICIGHCLESTLGFLPNTWKIFFSNTFHRLLLGDFTL